ncbi:glycosyltransferase family 39 protein [Luteimonas abyssi]|uniref:glycosyltransferase family 39 protein n=1 Tax=Luteimonas abyssi TaxID=1247514 RepID=UPI000737B973|nr:glycosyltransferase family 39 protein [Luteimonas abyssi]
MSISAHHRSARWPNGWHTAAVLVIFVAFAGRMALSGAQSYWLDELFSIQVHAVTQTGIAGVIDSMRGIIHPPLYQILLFWWIQLFGDTEAATRTLSNLFVAIASGGLYLFSLRMSGRRMSLLVLLVFSLMSAPVYAALETRSYAMVLMWACASSLAMCRFIGDMPIVRGWGEFARNPGTLALIALNTGALFTHYYMAFFIAAQGAFLLAVLLHRHHGWRRPGALLRLAVVGALPPLILIVIWGDSMVQRYGQGDQFAGGTAGSGFFSTFFDYVVAPNAGGGVALVLLAFALVRVARALVRLAAGRTRAIRQYLTLYVLVWALLPALLAFIVLSAFGQDGYRDRYFIFCTPPIAMLLVMGLFELLHVLAIAAGRLMAARPLRVAYRFAAVLGMVLALTTVAPGGYQAATAEKVDWRLIASMLALKINADPAHRYVIYDTGFRQISMFDYYLGKQPGGLHSRSVITWADEDHAHFPFDQDREFIRDYDYLVTVFNHHHTSEFPRLLADLDNRFTEDHRVMVAEGRGFIVYRVSGAHG